MITGESWFWRDYEANNSETDRKKIIFTVGIFSAMVVVFTLESQNEYLSAPMLLSEDKREHDEFDEDRLDAKVGGWSAEEAAANRLFLEKRVLRDKDSRSTRGIYGNGITTVANGLYRVNGLIVVLLEQLELLNFVKWMMVQTLFME